MGQQGCGCRHKWGAGRECDDGWCGFLYSRHTHVSECGLEFRGFVGFQCANIAGARRECDDRCCAFLHSRCNKRV